VTRPIVDPSALIDGDNAPDYNVGNAFGILVRRLKGGSIDDGCRVKDHYVSECPLGHAPSIDNPDRIGRH
jgi:hypothetical protein